MLLQLNEELEDLVVMILAENRPMSVQQIRARVMERNRNVSTQAIYKQLNKLEHNQVITKLKTNYTVNMAWAINTIEFATRLQAKTKSHFFANTLIPAEKEKKCWTLSDIWTAHEFWMHLAFTLMCFCQNRYFVTWYALPWFELAHRQKRPNLWNATRATGKHFYSLVGVDCPLTQFLLSQRPQEFYHPCLAPELLPQLDTKIITAFDDFLLTVETNQRFFNHVYKYFMTFDPIVGFDKEEVLNMLKVKTSVKITLEKNQSKAKKFAKLVEKYHVNLKDAMSVDPFSS